MSSSSWDTPRNPVDILDSEVTNTKQQFHISTMYDAIVKFNGMNGKNGIKIKKKKKYRRAVGTYISDYLSISLS